MSEVAPQDRLTGPSPKYLLGSDQLGRDLFSRLIYGARLSLVVGLSATALNVAVAVLIGGSSGFVGGKFDLARASIAVLGVSALSDATASAASLELRISAKSKF